MNVNFNFENGQISYVYSNYKIEKIRDRKYILPEKKATQNAISLTENIDKKLLALLNIGKKAYFFEDINDLEILNFAKSYGLLGFMADFPINKYYILEDEVIFRDYNFSDRKSVV